MTVDPGQDQAPSFTTVRVDELLPHPDNPRLQLRADVVERIAEEIKRSRFGAQHAILVRPVDGGLQVISGHHRVEAARIAGVAEIPAWVAEMDDDEAFMQLVLSNSQGELSPLEIGMHALSFDLSQGKAGQGLKVYADRIQSKHEKIRQLRHAADVLSKTSWKEELADKAYHLYEISKAPRDGWPALVESLVKHGWTVAETGRKVGEVKRFEIPEQYREWLPPTMVVSAYLTGGRPTSSAVERLVSTADGMFEHIDRDGTAEDRDAFAAWLVERRGGDSWDHRKLSDYHANLITTWAERVDEIDGGRIQIEQCRAIELLGHAEPGSVDLIFTDPPYPVEFVECWTELGELAVKALKPGGLLVAYTGQYTLPDALDRLRAAGLSWYWCYAVQHDGAFFRMNATRVQCGWKPLLVMRNGPGELPNWHKDIVTEGSREKSTTSSGKEFDGGTWQQSEAEAAYWISELSKPDQLVMDPFVGSGTTPAVCKSLGRRFIGCDVDSAAVQRSTERIA